MEHSPKCSEFNRRAVLNINSLSFYWSFLFVVFAVFQTLDNILGLKVIPELCDNFYLEMNHKVIRQPLVTQNLVHANSVAEWKGGDRNGL